MSIMGFMALAIGYVQRFCLSLAITEMVEPTQRSTFHNVTVGTVCLVDQSLGNTIESKRVGNMVFFFFLKNEIKCVLCYSYIIIKTYLPLFVYQFVVVVLNNILDSELSDGFHGFHSDVCFCFFSV